MNYKVKLVSQTNAIVFLISLLVVILLGAATLIPSGGLQNGEQVLAIVLAMILISCILWQVFVTGRTVWTIGEDEIKILWTRKFVFSDATDIVIKWNEVMDISRGSDPKYYNLEIKLVSGTTIRYFHDALTTRDDFEGMLKELYRAFHEKKAGVKKS